MKKLIKKTPAFVVVALIVVLTVAFSVFAASIQYDVNNDGTIDENDIAAVMSSIVGKGELSGEMAGMVDFDKNDKIDVLDVIALKNYIGALQSIDDGYTKGIY